MKFSIFVFALLFVKDITLILGVVSKEEDVIEKAKKAKDEYKKGEGLTRLKDKIPKENTMGLIFTWIRDERICLRRGTEAKNACYALSDFELPTSTERMFWFLMPYQRATDTTDNWYERLYNSVAKILLTEKEDEAPILLAKGGGISGKERYKALEIGIGEGYTFMKSTVNGEQIGPKMKLNVKESFKDLEDAVDKVLDMIIAAYEVDLKKGVDLKK
ncbi:uncharacterized protein LOC135681941 [Rhopilema esculentum]|uniref:uncharacterized protein LOC135681941 n=1 Tax=Rhopilema esculentum TaxID=499914 RepID=UPI0031DD2AD8|eukprot:gene14251-5277_t